MEFLARLSEAYARSANALKKAQARYKRDFDRGVRPVNKDIKVGDQVYLDTRAGATTRTQRSDAAHTSKLDYPVSGPFPVIGCRGHTYEIIIDGVPELVSSDRVRISPRYATHAPTTSDDVEEDINTENANDAERRDGREINETRRVDPEAGYGTREFMIDRLTAEGIDDTGTPVFRVRWKGYSPRDDTWEPEASLPAPIVARFRRDQGWPASKTAARATADGPATLCNRRSRSMKRSAPREAPDGAPRKTTPTRISARIASRQATPRAQRN